MSSLHIAAEKGEVAERILLPGDPLRAKFIAENFLEGAKEYTSIRNILGYTGTYKGVPVSVQGTGMGMPSISIYVNELMDYYGVQKLIRVGTCGGMHEKVKLRDVFIAQGATTDSGIIRSIFGASINYAPLADYELLSAAVEMEAAALYTRAAKYGRQALALFTVSDHLLTGEKCTAEERQTTFNDMIKIALETAIE